MRLSIIIPVFNEEKTIGQILSKVKFAKLPSGYIKEIIVVDDASSDLTSDILKKIKGIKVIRQGENGGKGTAVRTGILASTGEIILIQDADLEYDPDDYIKLIEPIIKGKAEVVYGSRLSNYPLKIFGKKKTPLVTHYLGNRLLTYVTSLLYGNEISDMETCYKVFKKEVIKGMKINAKRFEFEPEITAKIMKKGIKIFEVPIKVKPRGYEEGKKITWRDGFIALWTLIKYRFVD